MTTTIRLPLGQFEFIEQSFDEEMTPEAAVEAFRSLKRAYSPEAGDGLTPKDMNAALDEYLSTGNLKSGTELYAKMNLEQQTVFQAVKRSLARLKDKIEDNGI